MKYFWILPLCFLTQPVKAQIITVPGVQVSVTAESAAAAREKALDQAHSLALQALLRDNYPEKSGALPPSDEILNMVKDFSIDREKTTPTSYTASLTFQFDKPQVEAWLYQEPSSPIDNAGTLAARKRRNSLEMTASYGTFPEWQHIKRTLEKTPGIDAINILRLSAKNADVQVTYGGDIEKLQQHLLQQGLLLSSREEGWVIMSNSPLPQ